MHNNKYFLPAVDGLAFLTAFVLGGVTFWEIRQSENLFIFFHQWILVYSVVVILALVWFRHLGHYTRRRPFWDEMRDIFRTLGMLVIVEGALMFLTKSTFSRIWFATSFGAIFLLLPLFRLALKRLLLALGRWQMPTLIVGAGENARETASALKSEWLMGYEIKAFLPLDAQAKGEIDGIPVLTEERDPVAALKKLDVHCVVAAFEGRGLRDYADLIERLHRFSGDLYIVPPLRGLPLYGMEMHHFFRHEVFLLRVRNNLSRRVPRILKRGFDIFGAILLLSLLSPLFAYCIWRIRRDGGPAFFEHTRVGHKGKPFKCYKFRSMVHNAQEVLDDLLQRDTQARAEWERDFKLKDDPRITRIGDFLRRTSLDELPQLWNVLKGEMSLVGPRPVVRDEVERYGEQVDYYLQVRPGMTGLWQVSGRNDIDYTRRVYLDAWYVKNWSLWYDIAILVKTVRVVLHKQGAY